MTGLPVPPTMVPSAEERATKAFGKGLHFVTLRSVTTVIDDTYRDGFTAGLQAKRTRIIAALQKPPDSLVAMLCMSAFGNGRLRGQIAVQSILHALADWLESDAEHNGTAT